MVIKTAQEYFQSLAELKPKIFMFGKEIENYVANPIIKRALNVIAQNYEFVDSARLNDFRKFAIASSHLSGEEVARFNHIHRSPEDLTNMAMLAKTLGVLSLRHMSNEPLNSLYVTTFEIDQKYPTDYHTRFIEYVKHVQDRDLFCAITQTDPKGDRSLKPNEQKDPDLYLRVTEKRGDGIVVRGAKVHVSNAVGAHELIVIPCRAMSAEDKDYAISFAVPVDAEGIKHVCRVHPPRAMAFENPISFRYATEETLVIFDNVFVPWENVFMCGEWDFTTRLIEAEAAYHRSAYCGYETGILDLLIGAAALAAEYNGLEKATLVREKIIDMVIRRNLIYASCIAAAAMGIQTKSGACMPNPAIANAGKYYLSTTLYEDFKSLDDIAGGLVITMPSEDDYENAQMKEYVNKYLVGKDGIPTEQRLRLFRLIEDLTVGEYGAWLLLSRLHGGGSTAAQRLMVLRDYDMQKSKDMVKKILDGPST